MRVALRPLCSKGSRPPCKFLNFPGSRDRVSPRPGTPAPPWVAVLGFAWGGVLPAQRPTKLAAVAPGWAAVCDSPQADLGGEKEIHAERRAQDTTTA